MDDRERRQRERELEVDAVILIDVRPRDVRLSGAGRGLRGKLLVAGAIAVALLVLGYALWRMS